MAYYLKLKAGYGHHCFFCNLEQLCVNPVRKFMNVHELRHAEEFDSKEAAEALKNKWDANDDFEIVSDDNDN